MLREITSEQFAEWMAFYGLEPWGKPANDQRAAADDLRFGILSATVANFSPKFEKKDWRALDFMPGHKDHGKVTNNVGMQFVGAFQAMGAKQKAS